MDMPPEERHKMNPKLHEAHMHVHAAREEMNRAIESLLPPRFAEHRRAARREWLLAMHSWVEAAIDRLDRVEGSEPPPPQNPAV